MTGVDSEDIRRHLKGILGLRKDRPESNLGGEGVLADPWVLEKLLVSARAGAGGQEAQVSHGWWAAQVRPGAHGPLGSPVAGGHREVVPRAGVAVSWPRGHALGVYGWGRAPLDSPPH